MSKEKESSGLPMAGKWDPEAVRAEEEHLLELEAKPFGQKIRGYFKLTGPAWMQSAMTLGAGSAAASVVAGAFFGYQLLWVQPIAMFLGIFMMAALANITLTKGERGYKIVQRELHPSIAYFWALATVVSTVIWHFGQYALIGGTCWDMANVAGIENTGDSKTVETIVRYAAGILILSINIALTWNYGSRSKGIKFFEGSMRWMIRLVMGSFLVVVIVQAVKLQIDWGAVFKGFFTISLPEGKSSLTTVLGAIGAAIGINMTFLYPYSILAKGWGKHHKGLARFDLIASLFLPYVILSTLIIIGMASTVHGNLAEGITTANFKPIDAAQSLAVVLGSSVGRLVFDLGFMGMACSTIGVHMICCGFTVCEMFGLEYTPKRYRMFTLVPAIGILGVMIKSPIWLSVIASAMAFTMLPIAYVSFFILNNKRSYLGDAVGKGWKRWTVNTVLLVAVILSLIGAGIKIKGGVIDKIRAMTTTEQSK